MNNYRKITSVKKPSEKATHCRTPKSTDQGNIQTKTWSDLLHLNQEDPSHMFTQDGNTNKGCYIPPDTYIVIFSVPDHPGNLVIQVTTPCTHPLWCDDIHLYDTFVCFNTQGRLLCLPKPYFFIPIEHHIFRLVYRSLQYSSLFPEIWLQYLVVFQANISRV